MCGVSVRFRVSRVFFFFPKRPPKVTSRTGDFGHPARERQFRRVPRSVPYASFADETDAITNDERNFVFSTTTATRTPVRLDLIFFPYRTLRHLKYRFGFACFAVLCSRGSDGEKKYDETSLGVQWFITRGSRFEILNRGDGETIMSYFISVMYLLL